jgi:hypothetical protein
MTTEFDDLDAIGPEHAVLGDEKIVSAPEPVEIEAPALDESDFDGPDVEFAPAPAPVAEESLEDRLQRQQELIDKLLAGKPLVDIPEGYTPAPAPVQTAPVAPVEPELLVSDEIYDELMSDPRKFNDFLVAVLKKTREEAVAEAYGAALQNIPAVMEPSIHEAARNQYEVTRWMQENPILGQHQQAAATILNQVDAYHPALSLTEKLAMTLNTLNSHLGGAPQRTAVTTRPTSGVQRPAFAQAPRGSAPKASVRSGLQAELDELTL